MKKLWKGILGLAIAGLLMGTVLQIGCNPKTEEVQEQDKRLELLARNKWLKFKKSGVNDGEYSAISYRVDYNKEEEVHIFIGGAESEYSQSYYIYGRGDKILRIEWRHDNREIEVSVPDMKSKPDLPAEVIKPLIERGRNHYFTVREYFRVDTYEAAKKIIEEKTEQLKKDLEKTIR